MCNVTMCKVDSWNWKNKSLRPYGENHIFYNLTLFCRVLIKLPVALKKM